VDWLDNQLQNGGWVAWILDSTEAHKVGIMTFSMFILAIPLASRNPAESHRRGFWNMIMDSPWTISAIISGKLSIKNAAKQQFWIVFGSATDLWSVFHDDGELFLSDGSPLNLRQLDRHSLPFGWGYTDRAESSSDISGRPVRLNSERVRLVSVERGRVKRLYDAEAPKISYHVMAQLHTTCVAAAPTDTHLEDIAATAHGIEQERTVPADLPTEPPPRPVTRRRALQFQWTLHVHPLSFPALLGSWADSTFIATVIIGLWLTVASLSLGYGCIALGGTTVAFGYFSKKVIESFQVSDEGLDVLNMVGEIGKSIISHPDLNMIGGGILVLELKRCANVTSLTMNEAGRIAESLHTLGDRAVAETTQEPSSDENREDEPPRTIQELHVQWRKPLRPPHCPWFGVYCARWYRVPWAGVNCTPS
jgi:hypothetical protein